MSASPVPPYGAAWRVVLGVDSRSSRPENREAPLVPCGSPDIGLLLKRFLAHHEYVALNHELSMLPFIRQIHLFSSQNVFGHIQVHVLVHVHAVQLLRVIA